MKRIVWWLVALCVAAVAVLGIRAAHQEYASWWLTSYLIFIVAMPLVLTIARAALAVQRVQDLARALFSALLGLLLLTLIYQYVSDNWMWAVLGAMVGVGVVSLIRQWSTLTAQTRLTQANQLLGSGHAQQALRMAQDVRSVFVAKGNRQGQAAAERLIGVAYAKQNEHIRSARYLNSALALFKALEQEEQVKEIQKDLTALRARGVDVRASAVSAEAGDEVGRVDWAFLLDGVLSIAFFLILLVLWEAIPDVSLGILAGLGVLLILLLYGNYAVSSLARQREGGVRAPYLLFNGALLLLALAAVAFALGHGMLPATALPEGLQEPAAQLANTITGWPGWLPPAAAGLAVLLLLGALVWSSGRTPAGLLKALSRGDVSRQALQLAMGHLDNKEWPQAVTQLTRIDLTEVKDPGRRKEVLFCLAYAHHRAGHPAEARQYLAELLGEDGQHREGLYLSGYLALIEGKLDEAESAWRTLYQVAPRFTPPGAGQRQSAAYYLGLTLYRRAMQVIAQDAEKGAGLLAEVSATRALDREVADALVRVHLYRAADLFRQRRFDVAARELELAHDKLSHLKGGGDQQKVAKLGGLCKAGMGLVALKREQYGQGKAAFAEAMDETKNLATRNLFGGGGGSFLEQLLRLTHQQSDKEAIDRISRRFARDVHFLSAVAELHEAHEKLAQTRTAGPNAAQKLVRAQLDSVRLSLERSISLQPDFLEGRALLGLFYYHLGSKDQQAKGFEILETIRKRVGSRFISDTVAEHEKKMKRKADARQAYFDLLEQYLRSASVPLKEREALRQQVLADMKATGELEAFLGQGSLEIDTEREREPTVREYVARAALLAEKLEELKRRDDAGQLSPEVEQLMRQLEEENQELSQRIESIAQVERKLLLTAQNLLL